MTGQRDRDDASEDLLASPELRQLLRRARDQQPLPRVRVSADQIFDAWQARQRTRTRRWQHAVFAVAACLGLMTVGASVIRTMSRGAIEGPPAHAPQVAATPTSSAVERGPMAIPRPPISLTVDAKIAALEPDAPTPEIIAADAVVLGDGTYRITLDGEAALQVTTPNGALELRPGVFTVGVASTRTDVILERGEAFWIRDGVRVPVAARSEGDAASARSRSAAELARLAETELAQGRRSGAIDAFRRLVQTYPETPEAGRGLLDLARLLRADGDADAARCAYALYLGRQPTSALAGDVRRALDRLGPGRGCDGLEPAE